MARSSSWLILVVGWPDPVSRRNKILLRAIPSAALLILTGLALRWGGVTPALDIGTATEAGRSNTVLECFITNNSSHAISLTRPVVIREDKTGRLVTFAEVWAGRSETTNLTPRSSTVLSVNLSGNEKRVQFYLTSVRRAGALERALSRPVGELARKSGPNKLTSWLWRVGLVDGRCRRTYQHVWVPNEALQATAAPPSS